MKLRKRTQLKRTQQQLVTLGKRKREEEPERDSHLNDIDEEIFNDEDFYHQVCTAIYIPVLLYQKM